MPGHPFTLPRPLPSSDRLPPPSDGLPPLKALDHTPRSNEGQVHHRFIIPTPSIAEVLGPRRQMRWQERARSNGTSRPKNITLDAYHIIGPSNISENPASHSSGTMVESLRTDDRPNTTTTPSYSTLSRMRRLPPHLVTAPPPHVYPPNMPRYIIDRTRPTLSPYNNTMAVHAPAAIAPPHTYPISNAREGEGPPVRSVIETPEREVLAQPNRSDRIQRNLTTAEAAAIVSQHVPATGSLEDIQDCLGEV